MPNPTTSDHKPSPDILLELQARTALEKVRSSRSSLRLLRDYTGLLAEGFDPGSKPDVKRAWRFLGQARTLVALLEDELDDVEMFVEHAIANAGKA